MFAPRKVLRAIDTSSVGGLNYNGLETLRGCEELERYERGILPSETQGVEFDATDQQIIKVTGDAGKMLTSAESLVSTTQEAPIVTENGLISKY